MSNENWTSLQIKREKLLRDIDAVTKQYNDAMNSFNILVDKIKKWLDTENKILNIQKELKELKKNKKQISVELSEIMKNKNLDCIDVTQGKILYTKNKSKKGINKKYLETVLTKFYENNEQAKEICDFILENRETIEKENIRLKTIGM